MKKISIVFALLYTLTGCQSPIDDQNVSITENIQNADSSQLDSVEVVYKQVEAAKPLKKADFTQKGEVIETHKLDNTETEIYRLKKDGNVLAVLISIGQTSYAIGEIGYGDMNDFPVEKVNVLGNDYIKIVGAIGSNSPIAYYVLPDPENPLLLRIDGHTVEADVDRDGTEEIVSTVGTAANTTVYRLHDKQIMASDLNELMNTQVVIYDPQTNLFQIQTSNNDLTKWKFQGSSKLQLEK